MPVSINIPKFIDLRVWDPKLNRKSFSLFLYLSLSILPSPLNSPLASCTSPQPFTTPPSTRDPYSNESNSLLSPYKVRVHLGFDLGIFSFSICFSVVYCLIDFVHLHKLGLFPFKFISHIFVGLIWGFHYSFRLV